MNILLDFGRLYTEVIDDRLPKEVILKLIFRLGANTGWDIRLKNIKG